MAKCPLCAAQVQDDFGLMECANCGAQLIVHVDGRVEHSGDQGEAKVASGTQVFEFGEAAREIEIDPHRPEKTMAGIAPGDLVPPQSDADEFELPEQASEGTKPPELPAVFEDDSTQAIDDDATVYIPPHAPDSPDLSDIAGFGNSDVSSTREGSLRYTLFVSGIDTVDVRNSFREAITDRKLVWDIDQILRSVKNGEVKIQNVSAAKAFIVASRLRNLPVQVRWEQYAISQT